MDYGIPGVFDKIKGRSGDHYITLSVGSITAAVERHGRILDRRKFVKLAIEAIEMIKADPRLWYTTPTGRMKSQLWDFVSACNQIVGRRNRYTFFTGRRFSKIRRLPRQDHGKGVGHPRCRRGHHG